MQGFILAAFSIIPAAEKLTLVLDLTYEPGCEKTGLRGFRPGQTQTRLYEGCPSKSWTFVITRDFVSGII